MERFCPVCNQVTNQMEVFGIGKPPKMLKLKDARFGGFDPQSAEAYYAPIKSFACDSCGVITLNRNEIRAVLKQEMDDMTGRTK